MTTVYSDHYPELTRDRHAVRMTLAATLHHYDTVLIRGQQPEPFLELSNDRKRFYLVLAEAAIDGLRKATANRDLETV